MSSLARNTGRLTAAVVLTALGALSTGFSPASAAAAPQVSGTAPVMVVLDASGSMTTADAPGRRIDAAKRAVSGIVGNLPTDAQVGLEVYGTSTGSANSEKAAGCRDIKVLVPVGKVDRTAFDSRVDSVQASGYTPIGESLRKAAAALPQEGARSIVLVSDGEDTCAPPQPCDVARELKAQGVDLTVDTVGFKVDSAARSQLQCIAKATGGVYRDAPDGASLADRLDEQVQRALRPYVATGTPVSGGTDANDAPELVPGQYLDSYARASTGLTRGDGTTKTYRVTVAKGETPYFSATIVPAPRRDSKTLLLQVTVNVKPLDGSSTCSVDASGGDVASAGKEQASTAVAHFGQIGGGSCLPAGPALVTVARTTPAYQGSALPVELAYRVEPRQDVSGLPTTATAQPNVKATATGPAKALDSGASFNTAPLVVPGAYSDTAVSGESRYVRVHVGWGQRIAYSFDVAGNPGADLDGGVFGDSSIANPVREDVPSDSGSDASSAFLGGRNALKIFGSTAAPARYTNRSAKTEALSVLGLEGDYYVVLSTSYPLGDDKPTTVHYTLRVSVVGTPEAGPRVLVSAPSGSGAPTGSTTSAPSVGSRPSEAGASPQMSPAAAHTDDGVGTPVVVGGAVALVALVGAAGLALSLRRRRVSSTPTIPGPGEWGPPRY